MLVNSRCYKSVLLCTEAAQLSLVNLNQRALALTFRFDAFFRPRSQY